MSAPMTPLLSEEKTEKTPALLPLSSRILTAILNLNAVCGICPFAAFAFRNPVQGTSCQNAWIFIYDSTEGTARLATEAQRARGFLWCLSRDQCSLRLLLNNFELHLAFPLRTPCLRG